MSGPAPVTYANFVDQTNLGNTELPAYVSNSLNAHEDASCCSCFSSVALIFQSFFSSLLYALSYDRRSAWNYQINN